MIKKLIIKSKILWFCEIWKILTIFFNNSSWLDLRDHTLGIIDSLICILMKG